MTKDEIKFLLKNGFTIAEISEMNETADPAEQQTAEPEGDPTEQQTAEPEGDPTENLSRDSTELIKSLTESIDSLKKAIQASNFKNSVTETTNKELDLNEILNNIGKEYK